MATFIKSSIIHAPVERVFEFHEREDAFELLSPPFPPARVISRSDGINPGSRVVLKVGPIKWVALHGDYQRNKLFIDEQVSGPFARWVHRHEFERLDGQSTRLTDRIVFELRGGWMVTACLGWAIKLGLRSMFRYRHRVTRQHCESA